MRHDGRPEDAGPEQHALGSVEPGRDQAGDDSAHVWSGKEDLECEGSNDHADQPCNHRLETAETTRLNCQDAKGGKSGDDAGHEEWYAWKEKVDAYGCPDELRQVGRHG